MDRAGPLTAVAGFVASLIVSLAAWVYFDSALFFLFVPFVPFLFRRARERSADRGPSERRCPRCGFRTRADGFEFCPRDGTRLESADRSR